MKKKNIIITSCVSGALVLAITLCAILLPKNKIKTEDKDKNLAQTQSTVEKEKDEIEIEDIKDTSTTSETTSETSSQEVVIVTPEEPDVSSQGSNSGTSGGSSATTSKETSSKQKAPTPAQPVTPKPIPQGNTEQGNTSSESAYFCGNPKHHCKTEAEHRGITIEEERGCYYCGSHECPSFYCVDEWGGAWIDCTKCPKYDESKDPSIYCQDCGKKIGDGRNGTCEQYLKSTKCYFCGEWVDANTCHTCKE